MNVDYSKQKDQLSSWFLGKNITKCVYVDAMDAIFFRADDGSTVEVSTDCGLRIDTDPLWLPESFL